MRFRPCLFLLVLLSPPSPAAAQTCPGDCNRDGKVTTAEVDLARKVKNGKRPLADCPDADVDGNGTVSTAEIGAAQLSRRRGCPEPSPAASATSPPPPTPTAAVTAASLAIDVVNGADRALAATLSGQRLSGPSSAAAAEYGPISVGVRPGQSILSTPTDLAPGVWLHRVEVAETGQRQARQALLVADPSAPNRLAWSLFATVLRVNSGDDDGDGACAEECTLRDAIAASAEAAAPALIVFDHAAFPGGRARAEVTRNAALVFRGAGTVVDGTDASGHPSPLADFRERTYPSAIVLRAANAEPNAALDCPCNESPGGSLRLAAENVRLVGLAIERELAPEGTVCCGDQDLVAFDPGSRGGGIAASRLDGGAAKIRSAEVPSGTTRPPTGKDCIDASATGAGDDAPIEVDNTEIRFCLDRGVKSQAGWVRLRGNWIHHNLRGGVFAQSPSGDSVEGVVEANGNLLEQNGLNCPSLDPASCGSQQVVARGGASEISAQGAHTRIISNGDVLRDGATQGYFFEDGSAGRVDGAYVCGIRRSSGGKGIHTRRTTGVAGDVVIRGSAVVYNDDAGVKVRDRVGADLGSDGDAGANAFTANGAGTRRNVVNAMDAPAPRLDARGNQWQHCYGAASAAGLCDAQAIGDLDTNNTKGAADKVDVADPLPHQSDSAVVVDAVEPRAAVAGGVVRLRGSGFDAVSGHASYAEGDCRGLAEHNFCAPLGGTCVEFLVAGQWTPAADVLAVTPTSVTVRLPFTCTEPVLVRARRRVRGGGESVSAPIPFCAAT